MHASFCWCAVCVYVCASEHVQACACTCMWFVCLAHVCCIEGGAPCTQSKVMYV